MIKENRPADSGDEDDDTTCPLARLLGGAPDNCPRTFRQPCFVAARVTARVPDDQAAASSDGHRSELVEEQPAGRRGQARVGHQEYMAEGLDGVFTERRVEAPALCRECRDAA